MYRVIIVDDELLARKGIEAIIDWEKYGYELVGSCDNGKAALDLALQVDPDLIITDIKMPVMDGIELIKELKSRGVTSSIIVLSAYDTFDMVREALKLGADDYLLKLEMKPQTIVETLKRIEISYDQNKHAKVLEKDNKALMRVVLHDLLNSYSYSDEKKERLLLLLAKELSDNNLLCLAIRPVTDENDGGMKHSHRYNNMFIELIESHVSEYGRCLVFFKDNQVSVITSLNSRDELVVQQMTDGIKSIVRKMLNKKVIIKRSDFFDDFSMIEEKYKAIHKQVAGSNLDEVSEALQEVLRDLDEGLRKVDEDLIARGFQQVTDYIGRLTDDNIHAMEQICELVVYMVNRFAKKNQLNRNLVWDCKDPYMVIREFGQTAQAKRWIIALKIRLLGQLSDGEDNLRIVRRAKQYIHTHINENFSLDEVAEEVHLSSSYFSRLFCRIEGKSFVKYVTEVKIMEAQRMLVDTDDKIYEIAEALGYENTNYFSRVFKKVTGKSPKDFRK